MTNSNVTTNNEATLQTTSQTNLPTTLSVEDIALMENAKPTNDFKKDDLLIPFLQIVQATSGYVQRNDPAFVEAARPGDIIDSLTREPRQRIAFVPVKYETTFVEWKPNRGGLVKNWGTNASKYEASSGDYGTHRTSEGNDIVPNATYYGLIIFEDGATMPVVLNMTGSQYRKSKRLNALINMLKITKADGTSFEPPIYSRVYSMQTVQESNDLGSWYGWRVEPGSKLLEVNGGRAVFAEAQKLREQIDAGTARAMPDPSTTPRTAATAAVALDSEIPF
jgi:hypothetical protein